MVSTVLGRIIIPQFGPKGVLLWSGPGKERHDFVGEFAHIEVKTTTGKECKHDISMFNQLNTPPAKSLLFASVLLEKSKGGAETIANIIDQIREQLGNDGRAIDVFEKSLCHMNWHEELRQTGELLRFNFMNALLFLVDDTFPRLPSDFVMPKGLVGLRYTIDVSSRPSLSKNEVSQILAGH